MSRLTRLSLANRSLVALFSVLILIFGVVLIPSLRQQLLPSIEVPTVSITTPVPGGAGPEVIEQRLTIPIEDAVTTVDGVTTVSSTSTDGLSVVQAKLDFGTDLDQAVRDMRSAVDDIQAQLPAGAEPDVSSGGTDDLPAVDIAAYQAHGNTDLNALAGRLEQSVIPQIKDIDGVRDVKLDGTTDDQIVITPDLAKLKAAGIQPSAIASALQARGTSAAAGSLSQDGKAVPVQTGNPLTSVDSIGAVALPGSHGPVTLKSVARVVQQPAPATSLNRTNGHPSLTLGVTVAQDASAVKVSEAISKKLGSLRKQSGATLVVTFDQAPFVKRSIESLATEGLLGLLMAVLIILLFLRSVRSTVVTALSIPLSLVCALIALKFFDYSLNLLTLGALTVAVGRVVDDSIVVLENIKRHLGYGVGKSEAVLTGVREVAGAVTASTVTTVAVFLPIAFVTGTVGQLFAPFAITVTVALCASLLVALTVIPVLAYWFLKPPPPSADPEATQRAAEERESRSKLQKAYLPILYLATKHRLITVGAGLALLLLAFGLAGNVKTDFLEQDGQDTVSISEELPPGSSLGALDSAVRQVEAVLAKRTDLVSYDMSAGGKLGTTKATFSLGLKKGVDAQKVTDELTKTFAHRPELGDMTLAAGESADGGNSELSIVVKAADSKSLATAAEQVRKAMAGTPDVANVRSTLTGNTQRLNVAVDQAKAIQAGVTSDNVDAAVSAAFQGAPLGTVTISGTDLPVVLKVGKPPASAAEVSGLTVAGSHGPVTVGSVAEVQMQESPAQLDRVDEQRAATITGKATGSDVGATTSKLTTSLKALKLPAGASYEIGGVSQDQSDAFTSLFLAVLAAIALVFLVMVATFRSLVQPLVLLVSIPFAAVGAIGSLLLTGTALGVPALIGILMLVGIVVTNAIVLIDLVNRYRADGLGVQEAVVEGARRRLRPILMTALATIFALIPMGVGLTGAGGFISKPLAVVVIGGLVSSTVLTLLLVPTIYVMVEGRRERRALKKERKHAAAATAASGEATPSPETREVAELAAPERPAITAGSEPTSPPEPETVPETASAPELEREPEPEPVPSSVQSGSEPVSSPEPEPVSSVSPEPEPVSSVNAEPAPEPEVVPSVNPESEPVLPAEPVPAAAPVSSAESESEPVVPPEPVVPLEPVLAGPEPVLTAGPEPVLPPDPVLPAEPVSPVEPATSVESDPALPARATAEAAVPAGVVPAPPVAVDTKTPAEPAASPELPVKTPGEVAPAAPAEAEPAAAELAAAGLEPVAVPAPSAVLPEPAAESVDLEDDDQTGPAVPDSPADIPDEPGPVSPVAAGAVPPSGEVLAPPAPNGEGGETEAWLMPGPVPQLAGVPGAAGPAARPEPAVGVARPAAKWYPSPEEIEPSQQAAAPVPTVYTSERAAEEAADEDRPDRRTGPRHLREE